MSQTVVGLFENSTEANNAVQQLLSQGFDRDQIDIAARDTTQNTATSTTDQYYTNDSVTDSISNFFSSLFGGNDEAADYTEVARRGGAVVTVHARSTEEAQTAASTLDQFGTIDVADRASQYRSTGTTDTATTNTATTNTGATDIAATNTATTNTAATNFASTDTASQRNQTGTAIPIIEEQLNVGKQTVETGNTRVRSRIIERPVEENLRLREEHVTVQRNRVDRPATEADLSNLREGEINITEHAEVPVVSKEARVVEEVTIGKEVTERQETVHDTVRRTDVDVEEFDNDDLRRRSANS